MKTHSVHILVLLLIANYCEAQDSAAHHASFSFLYQSNAVYAGRKDSVNTPYLTPSVSYYHKSGLYATADASILLRSGFSRLDVMSLSVGYSHDFNNFTANVSASKYFYNTNSTNVKSEVGNEIDASLTYEVKNFSVWIEPGINPGKTTDYYFIAGLGKDVELNDHWDIDANFSINSQTRNFYANYYSKRKIKSKRGQTAQIVSASIPGTDKLQLMSSEFTLPVTFNNKAWSFIFTPVYSIASNPAQINLTLQPATGPLVYRTIQEKISNTLWFSLEITYKL